MTRSKGLFAIRSGYRTSFLYLLEGKQRSGKRKQPKDYHTVYQTLVAPYDNTANNTWLVFTGDFAVATNILKKKKKEHLLDRMRASGRAGGPRVFTLLLAEPIFIYGPRGKEYFCRKVADCLLVFFSLFRLFGPGLPPPGMVSVPSKKDIDLNRPHR